MENNPAIISREFNGVIIHQRKIDGYINATAMCKAFGKDVSFWLGTKSTFDLVKALAKKLNIDPLLNPDNCQDSIKSKDYKRISKTYPILVMIKRGSPENGGGTWIHYKLGIPLAQWLSPEFALLVSDWVEEWLTTGKQPIGQEDIERIYARNSLKDRDRLYLTDEIKAYLKRIGEYFSDNRQTRYKFAQVHDAINIAVTGETAKEMRERTGLKASELLRDYFPLDKLYLYSALTIAAANNIKDECHPILAVKLAARQVLPRYFRPQPIQLVDPVKLLEDKLMAYFKTKNIHKIEENNTAQLIDITSFKSKKTSDFKEEKAKYISRIDSKTTHGYYVRIYLSEGRIHSKLFSDLKHGGKEKSFKKAQAYIKDFIRQHPSENFVQKNRQLTQAMRNNKTTGILGVSETYDRIRRGKRKGGKLPCFSVCWHPQPNVHKTKKFYIHKYKNREEALRVAVAFRKEKQLEIFDK